MALPAELVIVRHAESEANVIQKEMRKAGPEGPELWTPEFGESENWKTRLSERGREQAEAAGEYVWREIVDFSGQDPETFFGRRAFSFYVRTMETGGLMGLPGPNWQRSPYLHERGWGAFDNVTPDIQQTEWYQEEWKKRKADPLFWAPPNGERLMDVVLRFVRELDTVHREVEKGKIPERGAALLVTHGEVCDAARIPLERMDERSFADYFNSGNPHKNVHNAQVIHYTRRLDPGDPESELGGSMRFRRSVCPWDRERSSDDWVPIERPTYTNAEMLEGVEYYPHYLEVAGADGRPAEA